jgi:hypothetical protein
MINYLYTLYFDPFGSDVNLKKNINFVVDHLMNIPTKFVSDWSKDFRE